MLTIPYITGKEEQQDHEGLVSGYAFFPSPATLPAGKWEIQSENGSLWVFSQHDEAVLHPGKRIAIESPKTIKIRSLYRRGGAKFTAKSV